MKPSMKELVLMSVENFMERKFNKRTEQILRDSEKGKKIKKYDSLEDLFDDLGI